uniref:Rho GTPase activating protein 30 n=1 Tax=Jaculus jaculus TaxID=51337 RepID=A0A8C5L392_JACJA
MKSRQKGKKKGNPKERVFGCDLQEHLQHSGQEVLFFEGVVEGLRRSISISPGLQEFEAERKPDLRRDVYLQDIHCVSSLCKAYFRELPDPLLTYRLYDKFAEAVAVQLEPDRLVKILEVLRELPVPNYRTLEFLMRHLVHMASFRAQTNMHARNLAIVWAPNLLRSKDIEASGFNGTAAFMEVRVQSIVVEFILTHVDQLFGGATLSAGAEMENRWRLLPGTRASGSSEDLMPRSLPYHLPSILQAGDGPPQIRPYHTIIEIAEHKRKGSLKVRKWRSIFNLGRSGHETKRKLPRGPEDREDKSNKGSLRPARSMDSLSAAAGASDEPEGLVGPSSLQSSSLTPESLENNSVEIAEGEQDPEVETLGGVNSEPGTPQASRLATRAVGSSRAERCAGVHISDPYNVNLPAHITSILNVPPNIISNVSLARLTRGLECPALQPRPSLASGPGPGSGLGPGPPDEKSEEGPVPGPLADSDPADMTLSLEDSLSQEVQDSFSFLEDSSSSEPEWVGAEDGEVAQARATGAAFSLGEDDPGMGYLEELLGVGPQVEEFSVEPPLDDLSLDEAQYVLAPSCCSLDTAGLTPEVEEENGEEIFLSAYDDLSPLLEPKPRSLEGVGNLKEEATGGGKQPPLQTKEDRTCWAAEENPEAEPKSTSDIEVEASETEQPFPLPPEPEGQFSPEGCDLWPSSFGFAGGVGMRLASTLVQVQQVRSVPVVPPKPQFAKMPSVTCSKIHVAPASPCPKPGRLDGIPTERALGSRASRASWRNGGSLSFDAAVALARERHRTEAQGLQRAQTCTGPGEYNLNPRTSACSMIPTHSLRPLSYLELPPEGTEKSEARSRLSLPPREPHPPISVMSPQRRTYAFETQANLEKDEGL